MLSARDVPRPQNLPQDFPESQVVRTNWLDINRWPKAMSDFRRSVLGLGKPSAVVHAGGNPEEVGELTALEGGGNGADLKLADFANTSDELPCSTRTRTRT